MAVAAIHRSASCSRGWLSGARPNHAELGIGSDEVGAAHTISIRLAQLPSVVGEQSPILVGAPVADFAHSLERHELDPPDQGGSYRRASAESEWAGRCRRPCRRRPDPVVVGSHRQFNTAARKASASSAVVVDHLRAMGRMRLGAPEQFHDGEAQLVLLSHGPESTSRWPV